MNLTKNKRIQREYFFINLCGFKKDLIYEKNIEFKTGEKIIYNEKIKIILNEKFNISKNLLNKKIYLGINGSFDDSEINIEKINEMKKLLKGRYEHYPFLQTLKEAYLFLEQFKKRQIKTLEENELENDKATEIFISQETHFITDNILEVKFTKANHYDVHANLLKSNFEILIKNGSSKLMGHFVANVIEDEIVLTEVSPVEISKSKVDEIIGALGPLIWINPSKQEIRKKPLFFTPEEKLLIIIADDNTLKETVFKNFSDEDIKTIRKYIN